MPTQRAPLHGSVVGMRRPPGPGISMPLGADRETADYRVTEPRHCWVATDDGVRVPGLLVEWRKPQGALWEARVVHVECVDGRWVQHDGWVLSSRLSMAAPPS